ncbi:MAG: helix-turn-helix domain containing protein [Desulfobacteraceae bacterium]|nr:helix-turn-helix domain containing protein [Desulfobacteraceae bacterium]
MVANAHMVDVKFYEDFILPSYLIGERFDRLTVRKYVKRGSTHNPNSAIWECECDCGKKGVLASSSELRKGVIRCCSACAKPKKSSSLFQVLKLKNQGFTVRQIAQKTSISKSTVSRWVSLVSGSAGL